MIDQDCWNTSYYLCNEQKCFISFSAEPDPLGGKRINEFYSVTLTSGEDEELLQKNFMHLQEAISYINNSYGHWNQHFLAGSNAKDKDGSGCSSCQAH